MTKDMTIDRDYFDRQVDQVLTQLPQRVLDLLREVPVIVEDYPSEALRRQMGMSRRDELCGLYTGIPITQRSIEQSGQPSDVIHLFRRGILAATVDEAGRVTEDELRRQIRLTILHEFGHYHGLSEEELEELGY